MRTGRAAALFPPFSPSPLATFFPPLFDGGKEQRKVRLHALLSFSPFFSLFSPPLLPVNDRYSDEEEVAGLLFSSLSPICRLFLCFSFGKGKITSRQPFSLSLLFFPEPSPPPPPSSLEGLPRSEEDSTR